MKLRCLVLPVLACVVFARVAGFAAETTTNSKSPPVDDTESYRLTSNDLLQIKIYQEDDLETKVRLAKDGTATFPLIGTVQLAGRTVEEATMLLRDKFDADYLVNPQVTLTVVEYSKRRFMVLGQVQKPGAFEIPNEETVTLLQAIAMAGGYTRLANPSRVTVTRTVDGRKNNFQLDAKAAAQDPTTKPFAVLPEDTITVAERVF